MDSTRRQLLQSLGVTIASTPLAPLVSGSDAEVEAQTTCVQTASETAGPYPSHTAFYRQDIRKGRPGHGARRGPFGNRRVSFCRLPHRREPARLVKRRNIN
jgi:hypothetical protein